MAARNRMVTEEQAHKLAEMWIWDAVAGILTGSTAPRDEHGQKAADKVCAIVRREQQRLYKKFDAELHKSRDNA